MQEERRSYQKFAGMEVIKNQSGIRILKDDNGKFWLALPIGKIKGPFDEASYFLKGHSKVKIKRQEKMYVDCLGRTTSNTTESGEAAWTFWDKLERNVEDKDSFTVKREIEKLKDKYFLDEVFCQGILKFIAKRLMKQQELRAKNGEEVKDSEKIKDLMEEYRHIVEEKRAAAQTKITREKTNKERLAATRNVLAEYFDEEDSLE